MATINDLPNELLQMIAFEGADLWEPSASDEENARKRLAFLCNFALVCQRWQHPGQSVLWAYINIGAFHEAELELFCASEATKAGHLVTFEVELGRDYTTQELDRFFSCCRGVAILRACDVLFDPFVLENEGLSGKSSEVVLSSAWRREL